MPLQMRFREAWAKSTDTPLRFFVYLLFVIESILATTLIFGMKYRFDITILLCIVIALIGLGALALVLVFILVAFFPKNLVFDKDSYLFEKALAYGDEAHIVAYTQLSIAKSVEAPKVIEHKPEEGKK